MLALKILGPFETFLLSSDNFGSVRKIQRSNLILKSSNSNVLKAVKKKIRLRARYLRNEYLKREAEKINQLAINRELEKLFHRAKEQGTTLKSVNHSCEPQKLSSSDEDDDKEEQIEDDDLTDSDEEIVIKSRKRNGQILVSSSDDEDDPKDCNNGVDQTRERINYVVL